MVLLDDDINTIQLVGTSLKSTYVTGNVIASNTIPANFNGSNPLDRRTARSCSTSSSLLSGVKSIELNGFDLSDQVTPAVTSTTGVFLYGGVGVLSFDSIDPAAGHGGHHDSVPDRHRRRDHAAQGEAVDLPQQHHQPGLQQLDVTTTTRRRRRRPRRSRRRRSSFMINGVVRNFDIISAGQGTVPAGYPGLVPAGRDDGPDVGAGDGHRQPQRARVRQEPDGVASAGAVLVGRQRAQIPEEGDVRRQCRRRRHRRQGKDRQAHLQARTGQPQRRLTRVEASNGLLLPQTNYGHPELRPAIPAAGDLGGQIRAKSIKKLTVRPANALVQTAQNPDFVQLQEQGTRLYVASPGYSHHQRDHHDDRIDRPGQHHRDPAQHRDQDRLRLHVVSWTGWREPEAPAQIGLLKLKGDLINSTGLGLVRPGQQSLRRRTGTNGSRRDQRQAQRQALQHGRDDRPRQHGRGPVRRGSSGGSRNEDEG